MLVGVDSFADVVSQVTGLIAETTGFATAGASATAVAAAVTPPGNDADSVMAVTQNATTVANYIAALAAGLEQLGERAAETTLVNTTFEGLSTAGAAAVNAI